MPHLDHSPTKHIPDHLYTGEGMFLDFIYDSGRSHHLAGKDVKRIFNRGGVLLGRFSGLEEFQVM